MLKQINLIIYFLLLLSCTTKPPNDKLIEYKTDFLTVELPENLNDSLKRQEYESVVIFLFSTQSCMECLNVAEEGLRSLKNTTFPKILLTDFANHRYLKAVFYDWNNTKIWETNQSFTNGNVFVYLKKKRAISNIKIDLNSKTETLKLLNNEALTMRSDSVF